jgi:DNA-binding MarR family transcriptional regulator
MTMEPRQSYSERPPYEISDETLARRNAELGVRINRVEMDVLCAIKDGHERKDAIVDATGLTSGQVEHALGVLSEQGMASFTPDEVK